MHRRFSALFGGLALSLVVTVMPGQAWAVDPDPSVATAGAGREAVDKPTRLQEKPERADAVSAATAAKESGDKIEDLSQRSEFAQVFANPDGTWTLDSSSRPERVQDAQGAWQDIDPTLHHVDGAIEPAHTIGGVAFSQGGDRVFASMVVEGRRVAWLWPTDLPTPRGDR